MPQAKAAFVPAQFVYLVMSHDYPEQVVRLLRTLRQGSPHAHIVLHHDQSGSPLEASRLPERVHQVPFSMNIEWGTFSLVEMQLRCFEWIDRHLDFDWLVLLSGQCYPIKPLADFERFIASEAADAYIGTTPDFDSFTRGIDPMDVPPSHRLVRPTIDRHPVPGTIMYTATFRYFYRYVRLPGTGLFESLPHRLRRFLRRAYWRVLPRVQSLLFVHPRGKARGTFLGVRRWSTPFSDRFRCYKASAWFTVSRQTVRSVLSFVRDNPRYVGYYRRTMIPDESFFQTIILNDPALNVFDDNLLHFRWTNPSLGSPDVLTVRDFDELRTSRKFMARKFDETIDREVLDRLDELLTASAVRPRGSTDGGDGRATGRRPRAGGPDSVR